jgi:Skp family chaperone for outer membrane proteins
MIRKLLVVAFMLSLAAPAVAIVPSEQGFQEVDARLKEIDAELTQIRASLNNAKTTDGQKSELGSRERKLQTEMSFLVERRDVLKRLERSGLLKHLEQPTQASGQVTAQ